MNEVSKVHDNVAILRGDPEHFRLLSAAEHAQPHAYLGSHPVEVGGVLGSIVRGQHPGAEAAWVVVGGEERLMTSLGNGIFATFIAGARVPFRYRFHFNFLTGSASNGVTHTVFCPLWVMSTCIYSMKARTDACGRSSARIRELSMGNVVPHSRFGHPTPSAFR